MIQEKDIVELLGKKGQALIDKHNANETDYQTFLHGLVEALASELRAEVAWSMKNSLPF